MAQPALKLDPARTEVLSCTICGHTEKEVRYLMAGAAGGHIGDTCITAAVKIVLRQRVRDALIPAAP